MSDSDENWDFYLTLLDGAPASVRVDLRWMTEPLPVDCTHLHVAFLPMAEPEEHGMGGPVDRDRLEAVEQQVFERVRSAGGVPVGRLRNRGRWQLCAYGTEALEWQRWLAELGPEGTEIATQPDQHSAYLLSVLLPTPERQLWMLSRRTVDQLENHGDLLHLPRAVHHRFSFGAERPPAEFLAELRGRDFEVEVTPAGARSTRFDSVELEDIHPLVVEMVSLADHHGGEYEGWDCDLEAE